MRKQIPILSFGLTVMVIAIHSLVMQKEALYFSAQQILAGEYWRLLSGHIVHADAQHLIWNSLGLFIIGAVIEQYSRRVWWLALLAGVVSVDVLLLSPFSELQYYCGLSGVLNAMLLVALWQQWQASRSRLLPMVFALCVIKVLVEVSTGESVISNISWPPYAWAHVAGLFGGLGVVVNLAYPRSEV